MSLKEKLIALKAAFMAVDFADNTPPAGGADAPIQDKLSDGTPVEYSKLDTGADISVTSSDGTMQPAPVGDYELQNGTMVTVTEAGKIAAVTVGGETPSDDTSAEMKADVTALKAAMAAQSTLIADQKTLITSLQAELSTFKKASGTLLEQFRDAIEDIANSETGKPAGAPKETVVSKRGKERDAARERVSAVFQQFADALKDKK